jgi:hypothetical protein
MTVSIAAAVAIGPLDTGESEMCGRSGAQLTKVRTQLISVVRVILSLLIA